MGTKGRDNEPKLGQKICSECAQTVRLFLLHFTPVSIYFILVRRQQTNIAV